jgi:hypothetical protein
VCHPNGVMVFLGVTEGVGMRLGKSTRLAVAVLGVLALVLLGAAPASANVGDQTGSVRITR